MAKNPDWVSDLIRELAFEGEGRGRKLNKDKVLRLLKANGRADTADKLADPTKNMGQVSMSASNALRGAAKEQRGLHVYEGQNKVFRDAPAEFLGTYSVAA